MAFSAMFTPGGQDQTDPGKDEGTTAPTVRSGHRFRAGAPSRATPRAAGTYKPAPRSRIRPYPAEERV